MKLIHLGSFGAIVAMLFALAVPAAAQSQNSMSNADVQRLEAAISDASRELAGVGQRDLSPQLEGMLEEAREDTIYLKVKMRKGESVPRSEYFDLRDRIDDIRARAKGTAAPPRATTSGSAPAATAGGASPSNPGRSTASRGECSADWRALVSRAVAWPSGPTPEAFSPASY